MPTILSANYQSLPIKINDLCIYIYLYSPDIICLTEKWLPKDIPEIFLNSYNIVRKNRSDGRDGGVLIFCKQNFIVQVQTTQSPNIESLWLYCKSYRMPRETPSIILGVIYHPPPPNPNQLMINHLQDMLDKLCSIHPDAQFLHVGDFNRLSEKFLLQFPLSQLVKHPTRKEKILGKILTNKEYFCFTGSQGTAWSL